MTQTYGHGWKRKIPGELLRKIRESEKEENRPQFNYIRVGPLYYLSLGELVPILRQKVSGGVVELFGGEWVINDIENILGLRNAICHARPVPSVGLAAIETLYKQMKAALDSRQLGHIVSTPDTGIFPDDSAKLLIPWMDALKHLLQTLQAPISLHDIYETATIQYWWGAQDLAGFDCAAIDSVAHLIHDYNALPAGVGSAARRQRFFEDIKPLQVIDKAIKELKRISP